MLLSGNLQKPASSQLATYQQGKVCERYTGRNISRQVRLLSAGFKASQSWTTWMLVPNIQTMLDSNAPKKCFFPKKQLFEDEISIWKEIKGAESFNPIEKCWVKNQSLQNFTKIEPKHKKKLHSPLPKRMVSPSNPFPAVPSSGPACCSVFFWQGGPTTSF